MVGGLFLIRHAQSTYNEASFKLQRQGISDAEAGISWMTQYIDCPLSSHGNQQAHQAVAHAHSIHIEKIFVSPLRRALETCRILFADHPSRPKIIVHPGLTEKLHDAPDVSLYKGEIYSEYSMFDWALMPTHYYIPDVISNTLTNQLRGLTHFESIETLMHMMKQAHPVKIESDESAFSRAQEMRSHFERMAENESVALVAHSNFFKFFTMDKLAEDCSFRWLENCEIYPHVQYLN
jgi:broad specificity phosphatase PhoE